MCVSFVECGYVFLKFCVKGLIMEDWIVEECGGFDMEMVFEIENGDMFDIVVVDKFFIYVGFYLLVLFNLVGIWVELECDNWMFGKIGEVIVFVG